MNYWILVDLALAALIAVCVYTGYCKGFVKSTLFLLALGIALALGVYLTGLTTAKLSDKYITPRIENGITKLIDKRENSEQLYDYLDRGKSTVDSMWEKIKAKLSASEDENEEEATETVAETEEETEEKTPVEWFSGILGRLTGGTILFILFFSAILAILQTLIEYLGFIDRIPVVNVCNKAAGIILGFVVGAGIIIAPIYIMQHMMPEMIAKLGIFTADNFSDSRIISLAIKLLG